MRRNRAPSLSVALSPMARLENATLRLENASLSDKTLLIHSSTMQLLDPFLHLDLPLSAEILHFFYGWVGLL